jgi:hypothetical protein
LPNWLFLPVRDQVNRHDVIRFEVLPDIKFEVAVVLRHKGRRNGRWPKLEERDASHGAAGNPGYPKPRAVFSNWGNPCVIRSTSVREKKCRYRAAISRSFGNW